MNDALSGVIPLCVAGCDFRVAGTGLRQRLVSTPEARAALLAGVRGADPEAGLVMLETCNRIEWVVSAAQPQWVGQLLAARMMAAWEDDPDAAAGTPYVYAGMEAATHVLNVVAGMKSLAPGEAQVAGQFHAAVNRAQAEGASSPVLNGLAVAAGRVAKAAARVGFRGDHTFGIHGLTAAAVSQHFAGAVTPPVVGVAGMGSIGRKAADLLENLAKARVLRFNRTVGPEHAHVWRPLSTLASHAAQLDAVVMATGSVAPLLNNATFPLEGRGKKLLVLDIGIPRQAADAFAADPRVIYRDVDDLLTVKVDASHLARAGLVDAEVAREADRFARFCRERSLVGLLQTTHRQRAEIIQTRIPGMVEALMGACDPAVKKQVEDAMGSLVREYSNDIFDAFHEALKKTWSEP